MDSSVNNEIKNIKIDRIQLGKRIKAIREKLKMNQKSFHALVRPEYDDSNGQTVVSNWERGMTKKGKENPTPDIEVLCRIAHVGNVSLEWLLMGDSDEQPHHKEYTWRDFCHIISDIEKRNLELNIELLDCDFSYSKTGETQYYKTRCSISFIIWDDDDVFSSYNINYAQLFNYFSTLSDIKKISLRDYFDIILDNELKKVPDTPILEKNPPKNNVFNSRRNDIPF